MFHYLVFGISLFLELIQINGNAVVSLPSESVLGLLEILKAIGRKW